jgi:hypothetical protein
MTPGSMTPGSRKHRTREQGALKKSRVEGVGCKGGESWVQRGWEQKIK